MAVILHWCKCNKTWASQAGNLYLAFKEAKYLLGSKSLLCVISSLHLLLNEKAARHSLWNPLYSILLNQYTRQIILSPFLDCPLIKEGWSQALKQIVSPLQRPLYCRYFVFTLFPIFLVLLCFLWDTPPFHSILLHFPPSNKMFWVISGIF